jgi:CIC family chloride channel protein
MAVPRWLSRLRSLPPRTRDLLLTCLYGLAAGGISVAFQFCSGGLYSLALVRLSHASFPVFAGGTFVLMLMTMLLVGFLLNAFCPDAAGSGIPQLKLAFWKDFGVVPFRVVWVKFVAGVLSLGGGVSLGREGPSVQIASATASCLAGWLGEPKHNRRPAAAAGAAAGLAAAFNTPLAAVTFVLEEVIGDLNSRFLGSILLASVIGAFVVHGLVGPQPAFQLAALSAASWRVYLLIPVVAAVASVVGAWFQKWALGLRSRQRQWHHIPAWCRPVIGGLVAWALGILVFRTTGRLGVFSLGYGDLSDALATGLPWKLAGVLLLAKFAATVACYGTGGCGGIFSPTLFFGGMVGLFLGGLADRVLPLSDIEHTTLAVVGMSCCLGAVVRAPVTGILIVFELTHEFSLVPALMLGALVSQTVSRRLCRQNFYDTILQNDGHELERLMPPRDLRSWQHLPVSTIANFRPVIIERLDPESLTAVAKAHPYRCFPVLHEGKASRMLHRDELLKAVAEARAPKLEAAVSVIPGQTIREVQTRLIESPGGIVVLTDGPEGRMLGIVTLHDLLRAELAAAERATE